jgi:hypothetical protein
VVIIGREHRSNVLTLQHEHEALLPDIAQHEWHGCSPLPEAVMWLEGASRLLDSGDGRRACALSSLIMCHDWVRPLPLPFGAQARYEDPVRNPDLAALQRMRKDSPLSVMVIGPAEHNGNEASKESDHNDDKEKHP